jgi:hypothetical protein
MVIQAASTGITTTIIWLVAAMLQRNMLPLPEFLVFIPKRRQVMIVTKALIAVIQEEIPAICSAIMK